MKHTTLVTLLCGALLLTLSACDNDADTAEATDEVEEIDEVEQEEQAEEVAEEEADPGHPIWGHWDPAEDLDAVQGDWVTVWGADEEVQTRWSIDGDQAVHHRTAGDDEPQEGTLTFDHPGAMTLTVELENGSTGTVSAFAREGDEIYVGLGMGGVVLDDRMVLRHGRDLIVYHDDGSCLMHQPRMFDGFDEEGITADCEIVDEGDEQYFVFTNPETEREITIDQRIRIGDQSLADLQLRSSLLRPAE